MILEILEGLATPAAHFYLTVMVVRDQVQRLRWEPNRMPPLPPRVAFRHFHERDWSIARKLMTLWVADDDANRLDGLRRVLVPLGFGVWFLGLVLFGVSHIKDFALEFDGGLRIDQETVRGAGVALIFTPFFLSVGLALRGSFSERWLESRLRALP